MEALGEKLGPLLFQFGSSTNTRSGFWTILSRG
jgi:uncharacterized protein YecE (DUF72 family)